MKKIEKIISKLNVYDEEKKLRLENCFNYVSENFKLIGTSNPSIKDFILFIEKLKPIYFNSWKIIKEKRNFKLCLIKYEYKYHLVSLFGGRKQIDKSLYFFGAIKLKKSYPRILIRPETMEDKIAELIQPVEIDFKEHKSFSKNYYVLSNEKENIKSFLINDLLNYLSTTKNLSIEFFKNECIFRLPKSTDLKETILLAEYGFKLDEIINKK